MNIYRSLNNEMEKGNTLINEYGDIVSEEKANEAIKKLYKNGIKDGSVDFTQVTFESFKSTELKKYIPVSNFLSLVNGSDDRNEDSGDATESEN